MKGAFLPITLALASCASGDRTPTTSTQEQQAVSGNGPQIPVGEAASDTMPEAGSCTSPAPSINSSATTAAQDARAYVARLRSS
jgi:hypothetical protein